MDNQKIKEQVNNKFSEYLKSNRLRKTPERFTILEHIYSTKGHFDIDSLYQALNVSRFRVSRATIYNTIDLLLDCELIVKHQFGANISQYERAYGGENHDHLICTVCGKVKEYKSENLFSPILKKKHLRFKISYYSLYIYGVCSLCQKEKQRLEKKTKMLENKSNLRKKK